MTSASIRIAHSQFQRWHLKTVLLKCQMLFSYSKATKKPTSQRWKKKRVKTTFSLFWAKQIFLQFRLPNQAITQGMWKSVFGNCLDVRIFFFSWSLKRQKVFLWSNFCLLCENSVQLSYSLSCTGDLAQQLWMMHIFFLQTQLKCWIQVEFFIQMLHVTKKGGCIKRNFLGRNRIII